MVVTRPGRHVLTQGYFKARTWGLRTGSRSDLVFWARVRGCASDWARCLNEPRSKASSLPLICKAKVRLWYCSIHLESRGHALSNLATKFPRSGSWGTPSESLSCQKVPENRKAKPRGSRFKAQPNPTSWHCLCINRNSELLPKQVTWEAWLWRKKTLPQKHPRGAKSSTTPLFVSPLLGERAIQHLLWSLSYKSTWRRAEEGTAFASLPKIRNLVSFFCLLTSATYNWGKSCRSHSCSFVRWRALSYSSPGSLCSWAGSGGLSQN